MAAKLPKPGHYRSGERDVVVIDPLKLSDSGEIMTKDADAANWRPAVAFKLYEPGGPLYVLSADVFEDRFKPTTAEEALARVQKREREESLASSDASRAEAAAEEQSDGNATAAGVEAGAST